MTDLTPKQRKERKITAFVIIILFAGFAWLADSNYNKRRAQLKIDGVLLTATITDIVHPVKSSGKFRYTFTYDNVSYTHDCLTGITARGLFVNETFPVLFSPTNKHSELLMAPDDFKEFGYTFPDSLQWVLKYKIKKTIFNDWF